MNRPPNDCFALPAGVDWTPVDQALAQLQAAMAPVMGVETIPLAEAAERILAAAPVARRAHPGVDNAAVDGYAFAHPGAAGERSFRLVEGRAAAGAPWSGRLGLGEALRIFTGAPMPDGADTVVLQEDATLSDGEDGREVRFAPPKKPGSNRRRAGENIQPGAELLSAGQRLGPAALAHALAGGVETVEVYRPLTVGVLSTGDELTASGAALPPEAVIDTNRPMLIALARRLGVEVVDLGAAADRRDLVEAALDRGAEATQALIVSGGASGGDEDHMARALKDAAARDPESAAFHQWRIAMKPGRPLAMGLWRGVPVFGLPGNPIAAFVCFLLFARPTLLRLAGAGWTTPRRYKLRSGFDYDKKRGRREFLRVRVGADGRLEKYRSEGSGLIEGLVWSDGLADLPHDSGPFAAGDEIDFIPYSELGASPL